MIQSLARVRATLHSSTLDVRLAQGADPAQSPELSRRARLLMSDRTRHDLAAGIERVVEAADAPAGGRRRAVPLQRVAIRETRTRAHRSMHVRTGPVPARTTPTRQLWTKRSATPAPP